jgi:hypothetical protein
MPGHGQVHHHDVGLQLLDLLDGVLARLGLAHDFQVGLGVEERPEPCTQDPVIVRQQDFDRLRHLRPVTGLR